MWSPTNRKQVQSFIAMNNYSAKFSPRLSDLVEPITELAKDKVPSNWGPEHQAAFIHVKKEIASAPVLAYYNPKKQNYPADRCQHQRSWCLSTTRFKTSLLCKQGSCWCTEKLYCNWVGISCSGLGNGEVPSFFLCQSFSAWNRPETARSYIIQKVLIKLHQDCKEYFLEHLHTISQWITFQVAPTSEYIACPNVVDKKIQSSYPSYMYIKPQVN